MSKETYRFKTGTFECIAVSDGTMTYKPPAFPPPPALLFSDAPQEQRAQALQEYGLQAEKWTEWTSPYICLVIKDGEHVVLVDTGADGLAPTTGKLIQNLKAEGITPGDIDTVIITHAHPDHIGGNTGSDGKPVFRNARYVMWRDEWDFWTSERAEQEVDEHSLEILLGSARRNLPPIQGQLELVNDETEILPGIKPVPAPGHTPGHMALAVSSQGDTLLCISDTVLHPVHLEHPEWHAAVDIVPEQVTSTRRFILNRAATEGALVLAFHFPFPGLGYVVKKGDAWQWQPLEAAG